MCKKNTCIRCKSRHRDQRARLARAAASPAPWSPPWGLPSGYPPFRQRRRQALAVELANRESRSSWRDFLLGLKARGLHGVEFVVADDHAGLRAALREALAEAANQRCYVHFLRNALAYVPRRVDDDCLQELRWLGACPRAGKAGPGGPA